MRFLIDEMYPPVLTAGLVERGVDAQAVVLREDLRGQPDPVVFATAQAERRAVVTENVRDFLPLAADIVTRGGRHHGLVCCSPKTYPRGRHTTITTLTAVLERLASQRPGDEPMSEIRWA